MISLKTKITTSGFTFIEVLLAIVIFVIAILAVVDITRGSVRATRDIKDVSTATWLLKRVMVELETKIEGEGFEKACEKKKTGKFDPPYDRFVWTTECIKVDFKLSQTAQALTEDKEAKEETKENMLQKMILNIASDYITKSMREIHAEVEWVQGKNTKRSVDVTTHIARYDQPITPPAIGGGS